MFKAVFSILIIMSVFLAAGFSYAASKDSDVAAKAYSTSDQTGSLYRRFNDFNNLVRDGKISPKAANRNMNALLKELKQDYYRRGGKDYPRESWVFPLQGYDARSITGGRNKGYIASGYDYFTGNRHGGHPSFDIFIRDRNQDSRDDRRGLPVKVLSLGGGVVVALENAWERGSRLRGGKYIWVYDPANELLVYYAHNGELFVELGSIVKPGDVLAHVGRSGLNAAKRRSPTHLHLTVLEIKNERPEPINVYVNLIRAGKVSRFD